MSLRVMFISFIHDSPEIEIDQFSGSISDSKGGMPLFLTKRRDDGVTKSSSK